MTFTGSFAAFPRKRALGVAAGAMLVFASGVAWAQPLMPLMGNVFWPGLSQDDLDRMGAAAARLYEGRSIGTVERWRSPDSNNAGEVSLLRSFTANDMPCRTLQYTVRFARVGQRLSQYVVNWCKIPSGEWKIVELPRSR